MTTPLQPKQFAAHVAALPPWDEKQDDDPNYVRPSHELGARVVPHDDHLERLARKGISGGHHLEDVPVHAIKTAQPNVRLDAVAHYLGSTKHYDPDPWYGTKHPVVAIHPTHGPVVLDGNSRVVAARMKGQATIKAHVIR